MCCSVDENSRQRPKVFRRSEDIGDDDDDEEEDTWLVGIYDYNHISGLSWSYKHLNLFPDIAAQAVCWQY